MTNYIFVTGGVVSSLGKGVTAAALGRLLKSRGVTVSIQKLDPYLNVDPGTMSPYQHGEVFVTEDGAETDLDLGHYERFIDENLSRASNVTAGQIYAEVIGRERRGDYLGGTIQVIPHVTNEIKRRIAAVAKASNAEVIIVEVGGTVGDIEGLPFLEAIRQMRKEVGRDNSLYLHVTWMPYVAASGELKTKPTQHSVRELRSIGIQPDVIVCRSDHPVEDSLREKIALFCDVDVEAVVPLVTADTVYAVPLELEMAGLAHYVLSRLGYAPAVATAQDDHLAEWRALVARARADKPALKIGVVGKYVQLEDAYMSVREALLHAAWALGYGVEIIWISSEDLEKGRGMHLLQRVDGIVVPGGFGYRGIEGKIVAARYAREQKVPYLGLCLGMQVLCIEFARHIFDSDEPNSVEFDPTTRVPVIDLMPDQRVVEDLGGTMRLGIYPCKLAPGTRAAEAYQSDMVMERHRHRFEFNNAYRAILEKAGLVFSGLSPDGRLVEIAELRDHPWMLGSQFHPEFKSRPTAPRPLFLGFIRAVEAHVRNRP
ncbi:MAG: CTP synthase [Anaerolineae bacterium]|uniref:CTP synthase n=1 Tax=Candidatus Amarolinea dominans TaxID=3140696 RepID=UPI003135B93C|nr:CTP synthase [Anaerolineae bacterium]MBK9094736.1 CTP synthase [Anaerolineae bacterium]MBK9234010.1 CTP synthase [Anaerolineae bacterium]